MRLSLFLIFLLAWIGAAAQPGLRLDLAQLVTQTIAIGVTVPVNASGRLELGGEFGWQRRAIIDRPKLLVLLNADPNPRRSALRGSVFFNAYPGRRQPGTGFHVGLFYRLSWVRKKMPLEPERRVRAQAIGPHLGYKLAPDGSRWFAHFQFSLGANASRLADASGRYSRREPRAAEVVPWGGVVLGVVLGKRNN